MTRTPIFALCLVVAASGCAHHDKVQHAAVGAVTSAAVTHFTGSKLAGCAASLALGVGKEVYDRHAGGNVEALDAIATGAGGCVITFAF